MSCRERGAGQGTQGGARQALGDEERERERVKEQRNIDKGTQLSYSHKGKRLRVIGTE